MTAPSKMQAYTTSSSLHLDRLICQPTTANDTLLRQKLEQRLVLFLGKDQMLNLLSLPYEVLSNIVGSISFDDYYNLGQSCKHLSFLLEEERICKLVVQTKIPHSNEAREAIASHGGHARSFRRAAKRYGSLATAVPFVVATVGVCEAFLYCNGFLCYTIEDTIRVLSPHLSSQFEVVISIPELVKHALCVVGDNSKGNFLVLYFSDSIISCLYKTCGSDSTGWLIAFDLDSQTVLVAHELASTDKIFVRHNAKFLYYGTHSEVGTDGYKKWIIHGYEFATSKWFDEKIHLPDMVGSEIGSTVCFEFYNGFFYALSNQTSFEVEEIDWTSFYHCVRFPLDSPCKKLLEKTENEKMWRRQHQEGPIDDRWTVLRLDVNESSGELNIVEARKEWYLGSSKSQRTYYTTPIVFPDPEKDEDLERAHLLAASAANSTLTILTNSSWVAAASSSASSSSAGTSSSSSVISTNSSSRANTVSSEKLSAITNFPNAQLAKLLMPDDNPNHIEAPLRRPQDTHPGNDGSSQPTITLAKSRIRTYHTSCSTFVDLIDDQLPSDIYGTQRLRLRSGTRHLRPPLRDANGLLTTPSSDLDTALKEMYDVPAIKYWPDAQDPEQSDEGLDAIYGLLNPPSHLGNVRGQSDERSIVYSTGPSGFPQALIFISFDPATKLEGLKSWGGLCRKGLGEGPHIDGRAAAEELVGVGVGLDYGVEDFDEVSASRSRTEAGKRKYVDVGEVDRTVVVDRKGKGKACDMSSAPVVHVTAAGVVHDSMVLDSDQYGDGTYGGASSNNMSMEAGSTGRRSTSPWIRQDRAMHRDIGVGFYFGMEKRKKKASG